MRRSTAVNLNTNYLVGQLKRLAVPLVFCLVLGGALANDVSSVYAAQTSATKSLNEADIAGLVNVDRAIERIVSHVNPAVVNVAVTAKEAQSDRDEGEDEGPLAPFFSRPPSQGPQMMHDIGSGAIISADGYIVTNQHVVAGAVDIRVTLNDRRVFPAKLIGTDKLTDLAVLKIDGHDFPFIEWGDSTKLHPGQTVLAFGSPFGFFRFSVTKGIVSAVNRPNPFSNDLRKPGGFIQTDAAINRGNSGGPLVDAKGQLVGINTFLISDSGSFAGAGFAIPSQIVQPVVAALIRDGVVHHGYLGISIEDVTPENAEFFKLKDNTGALVSQVSANSPGAKAGIHSGDVIQRIDGTKIEGASDLQLAVSSSSPGRVLSISIIRDGRPITLNATVGEFKESAVQEDDATEHARNGTALGIGVTELTPELREQLQIPDSITGVVVRSVRPGSPAEDAGLETGDLIQEINRHPVKTVADLTASARTIPSGKSALLLLWSHGNSSYRVLHPLGATQK